MTKELDFEAIKNAAESHRADMTRFLRAMISHPFMGEGDKIIAIDSHIDTVGIGNIENWDADPYEGYETDEIIYGRGGSDQEGGMASATYAAKMMKDMGLIPEGYKIMVVGTVQEEDCDGMCWQYIYNKDGIKPEFVISTEPTDGGIYRGHRGRMEIRVDVHGTSCHGSAPDRGDNSSRCSTPSTTPSTSRMPASWAAAPAPSARSSTPAPAVALSLTPAPSPSTVV